MTDDQELQAQQLTEAYAGSAELRLTRAHGLLIAADALHDEQQNALEQLTAAQKQQRNVLLSLAEKLIRSIARRHMEQALLQWESYKDRVKEEPQI